MNNTTAYRYNDAQPEWMYAISAAWEAKTDLGEDTVREILKEWHIGSIKLVVEYDVLIKLAVERGLIEAEDDYLERK
jgi:hypothetical protein